VIRECTWQLRCVAGAALLVLVAGCAGAIVDDPAPRLNGPDEIRAALHGDDFRLKSTAREQLGTLPAEQQVALLGDLLAAKDPQTRLLAVAELSRFTEDVYRPLLGPVAAGDPDLEVREFAAAVLGDLAD